METVSDVIVVGGGPCGSFAAFNLAKKGVNVTVFEEHAEIGVPSHCAGHLSIRGLKNLGLYPLPSRVVENVIYGVVFHSPNGESFSLRFAAPVTCSVNRVLFDKHLAKMAADAGARYFLRSKVESLVIENSYVCGVYIRQNRVTEKYAAKIVIDAEGVSPRLLRQAGLPAPDRSMAMVGVEAEVENVENIKRDMVEVFLGKEYAEGFFAWLIPQNNGHAKIGLASKTGNPQKLLQKLMTTHPVASRNLCHGKITQLSFHPLSLGGSVRQAYSNGFLAVGDAASHVKPTTGGGVILGMSCAKIAAEVAYTALKRSDVSSVFLSTYQRECDSMLGFDMSVMLRLRKMFNTLSDRQVDKAIRFCRMINLGRSLQEVEEIDLQGKAIFKLLRNPRMLAALFYFLRLYLFANI
ncbi:MAG: NAD(P)/FAD-dependent oxidoreductase [Candidatus Bathyarchaeota archaeon]|nr:NAD(P)/FAD-dependent oxidoreductase [Candidatus Bathyarchaeota archaeon]